MQSEFEEKSFEGSHQTELLAKSPVGSTTPIIVSMGQVVEAQLGFDLVARLSAAHPLFRVLGPIRGNGVAPSVWRQGANPARVPQIAANLFIQYKRSEHLSRSNAKHIKNGAFANQYYRFRVYNGTSRQRSTATPRQLGQHDRLAALETNLSHHGAVIYAAPRFHTWGELLMHMANETVLDETEYVYPSEFGSSHDTCVYYGNARYFNPGPSRSPQTGLSQILRSISDMMTPVVELLSVTEESFSGAGLLEALSAEERTVIERTIINLATQDLIGDGQIRTAVEYATITAAATKHRLSWFAALDPLAQGTP